MTDWGASMTAAQLERLNRGMDELREDIAELMAKTEGLNQRMAGVERRLERIDGQTPVSWQTWFVVLVGLLLAGVLVAVVFKLGVGG